MSVHFLGPHQGAVVPAQNQPIGGRRECPSEWRKEKFFVQIFCSFSCLSAADWVFFCVGTTAPWVESVGQEFCLKLQKYD